MGDRELVPGDAKDGHHNGGVLLDELKELLKRDRLVTISVSLAENLQKLTRKKKKKKKSQVK